MLGQLDHAHELLQGQAWGSKKFAENVQNYLYLLHFLILQSLPQKHNLTLC